MAKIRSPILGGFYRSWSLNLADQQCINVFPTTVDTKPGKDVGALYSCPGLTFEALVGNGPIRGMQPFMGMLYVVSGSGVYTVSQTGNVTLIGNISAASSGPVDIINNTMQLVIFDGVNGYLVPGGFPLTAGGSISGGTNYSVGDLIYLQSGDGTQTATAVIQVATLSGSAVATFTIVQGGAFNPKPTTFTQQSTTGSGSGFSLSSPTYGAFAGVYTLTLPFLNPASASYQDGFGVVSQAGTQVFWQSNLFDLSIWDPLNFSSADSESTNIIAIAELHEQQFIFTETIIEVWINAGQSGFAFQRLTGVHMEIGCAAQASVTKVGEGLIWLSQTDQGGIGVHEVSAYEPVKISTKAIDGVIQSYSTVSDAIGYAYSQDGHDFYVLIFPTANATWVYDPSVKLWHQRAAFANGQFSRHWSNCGAFFGNKNIVGDYRNGNIYSFQMNMQTDNGTPRKWVRSWRALEKPIFVSVTYSSLQIDMQTGIRIADGTNPQVVLRWSDDGCHNWSNERFQAAGQTGQTKMRVIFKRLGSTKLNAGLDRVWELSSSDAMPVAIIGADQL